MQLLSFLLEQVEAQDCKRSEFGKKMGTRVMEGKNERKKNIILFISLFSKKKDNTIQFLLGLTKNEKETFYF